MTDLAEGVEAGRSASPPGRESRDDWRGRNSDKNSRPLIDKKGNARSRSRSPLRNNGKGSSHSPNREMRYVRDGTNTTSREPHLERARLFVGNVDPRVHRRDIIEHFSKYGNVLGVSVHKGYCFVQMDRERTANKAINYEDNKTFMGSRIHVEFSQAALKAGAKFERLSLFGTPPPLSRDRPPAPPLAIDPYIEDQERQREERLARILQMERELALIRSREGDLADPKPPSRTSDYRDHDRDRDIHYRRSPGPPPSFMNASSYQSSYTRERSAGSYYQGAPVAAPVAGRNTSGRGGGTDHDARAYYGRNSPPTEYTTRGYSGNAKNLSGDSGAFRDQPSSYPSLYNSGSGGYNRGGQSAASYGPGGSKGGMNSSLPPGWPSNDGKQPPLNRPPFSSLGGGGGGPWS